ncbi:MAG: acyl carrier protein [Nitrospiraceae bacterium]
MATQPTIEDRIRTALGEYLKRSPATIDARQSLRDDLGLDSMATIELLFRIEEVFDLQIPDEDLQKLVTVADVTAYVQSKVAPSNSRPRKAPARRAPAKKPTVKKAR